MAPDSFIACHWEVISFLLMSAFVERYFSHWGVGNHQSSFRRDSITYVLQTRALESGSCVFKTQLSQSKLHDFEQVISLSLNLNFLV